MPFKEGTLNIPILPSTSRLHSKVTSLQFKCAIDWAALNGRPGDTGRRRDGWLLIPESNLRFTCRSCRRKASGHCFRGCLLATSMSSYHIQTSIKSGHICQISDHSISVRSLPPACASSHDFFSTTQKYSEETMANTYLYRRSQEGCQPFQDTMRSMPHPR